MSTLKVGGIRGTGASADAITVHATDGTWSSSTAQITNIPNINLVTNGAMQVAQRGTSSTTSDQGYTTVDMWQIGWGGADNIIETHQEQLAITDTGPWEQGFRYAYKLVNGNQTGGADAGDSCVVQHRIEAQDLATSGWDYRSASSYVTLSFWVKSSVAQAFQCYLRTPDTTSQEYSFNTGTLNADTWTKVTKVIPGNTNIVIDNNTDPGMYITFWQFAGTDFTASVTDNAWRAYNGSQRTNAQTSTWWTTNDATFHLTGVQLEVATAASNFYHLPFSYELARCQRYFEALYMNAGTNGFQSATSYGGQVSNNIFAVSKRTAPTFSLEGNATWVGTTPNVFTDTHNFIFHHGSTAFALSDATQDLCGSFSCEL